MHNQSNIGIITGSHKILYVSLSQEGSLRMVAAVNKAKESLMAA